MEAQWDQIVEIGAGILTHVCLCWNYVLFDPAASTCKRSRRIIILNLYMKKSKLKDESMQSAAPTTEMIIIIVK